MIPTLPGLPFTSRFAPTPSGFLHQGNAFHFLMTWLLVRRSGGTIWLRIDDMDESRCRPEYVEDVFRTLDWLGLDWDQGPSGVEDHLKHFRQRLRMEIYEAALQQLWQSEMLFACTCSRKDIISIDPEGAYPGTCRNLQLPPAQPDLAWRIRTPWPVHETWHDALLGRVEIPFGPSLKDVVLRKKDGWPAYQLSSLLDDQWMGSTLIVRGEDLLDSTACQIWLSRQLGIQTFPQLSFVHHPLLVDPAGQKLSKSAGSQANRPLQASGVAASDVIRSFARWIGWQRYDGNSAQDLLVHQE